jgi:hypothetical protein
MNQVLNYIQKYIDFSGEEVGEVLMTRVLENGLFEIGHLEHTICRWNGITIVVDKDEKTILKVFRNGREKLARAVFNSDMANIFKAKAENQVAPKINPNPDYSNIVNLTEKRLEKEASLNKSSSNNKKVA